MNVRWKVDGGETNLRQGSFGNIHENSSISQWNDYYKAQQRCIVRTIVFCRSFSLCASTTLYAVQSRNYAVALRPRFHAYVVSVFTG